MKRVQKGHVTLKWYVELLGSSRRLKADFSPAGTLEANQGSDRCGRDIVEV
jgi:hypothetical protein